jgi:hypothetical protein
VAEVKVFEDVLGRVREVRGIVSASVVGIPGGQILDSVFKAEAEAGAEARADAGASIVAGAAVDIVRVVSAMTLLLAQEEHLEDVVLTLSSTYHLLRPLPGPAGEGTLLLVTLDRARTNLALARRQLRDVEAGLVS